MAVDMEKWMLEVSLGSRYGCWKWDKDNLTFLNKSATIQPTNRTILSYMEDEL